ncbi:MAG: hypothetical protein KKA22_03490 [Gammaproteobacteria bacterium]|nr:hypothetical protein [Gammaproteobacteria bacterium]MBU1407194.1 hypothetical protein [Gammaproteobacteria bacterium]MBU1533290.1 hypothetical protein [Gammaproteobacteria bacterium]
MAFNPCNRTYYVSNERLRAFRALPAEEKLRWVEELAAFLRLAQPVKGTTTDNTKKQDSPT